MAWVRLDDRFWMHPKVMRAGNAASWLWVASIGYCNANLTDGRIPTGALPLLTEATGKRRTDLVATLVDVGLWEPCEGGWMVHDYLDFQPSSAEVLASRAATSARVAKHRSSKKTEGIDGSNAVTNGDVTPPPVPVPVPTPTDQPSVGSEPSPRADGATAPTDDEKASPPQKSTRTRRPVPVDTVPLPGTLARKVYDVITRDPVLGPITGGPGDLADRVTREGAYPRVDVLAQVLRAGEYAARFPGKYSDGRRFLARWLQTAADDAASRPSAVPAEPVSDEPVYEDWTGRGHRAPTAPAIAPGGVVRAILAPAPTEMAPEAKAARIALLRAQLEEVKAAGGTGEP